MGAQPSRSADGPRASAPHPGGLRDRYLAAVADLCVDGSATALLPQLLVEACVRVLGVDGAGLSLTGELRIPVSASSPDVAEAERWQTSLGEGPCLTAAAEARPVAADSEQLERRWPVFASQIRRCTPFRSAAALPLGVAPGAWFGAVDLYSTDPSAPFGDLQEVSAALAPVMTLGLLGQLDRAAEVPGLVGEGLGARDRFQVWTAVGLLMATVEVGQRDALALLRGYAFRRQIDLDTAAALLVDRVVLPSAVVDL